MDRFLQHWTQKESEPVLVFSPAALPFIPMNEQLALLTLLHMLCGSPLICGLSLSSFCC